MTPAEVTGFVHGLDPAVEVTERPGGGFRLSRGTLAATVAANAHAGALRAYLSDAVVALRLMEAAARRDASAPDGAPEWRADVDRRLAALEQLQREAPRDAC